MVDWLPCLRLESQRWFLPRSHRAGEVIARTLLASRDDTCASDSNLLAIVVDHFRRDPALMLHALVSFVLPQASAGQVGQSVRAAVENQSVDAVDLLNGRAASSFDDSSESVSADPVSRATRTIELVDLAGHWIDGCVDQYAQGDAWLSAPKLDSRDRESYESLASYFQTIPFERWSENAGLWFEVAGPSPVPNWLVNLPRVVDQQNGLGTLGSSNIESGDWLQNLAREIQSNRVLSQSFDQTLHQKQMRSLRQLAYGLSHEINNPLANISTRAEALLRDEALPPSQNLSEEDRRTSRTATLQRIVEQVYRAYGMISDLMFYASPPEPAPENVELAELVNSVLDEFVGTLSLQSIRIDRRLQDGISADIDPLMFGEAVRGLVRNAVEAIGCQGTIVVSSEWVGANELADSERVGGKIRLHIADSGPGLSDEARHHAFDPYYSGREAGRGLGLGLCRAYRIVELHGGELSLAGGPAGCVATITF